jgi:hypothetical protein
MKHGKSAGGTGARNPKVNYNKPSNPGSGSAEMSKVKSIAGGAVDSGDGPPQNATGRYKTP